MNRIRKIVDAEIDRASRRLRAAGVLGAAHVKPGAREPRPSYDDRVSALGRRGKAPAAALRALHKAGRRTSHK